MRSFNLREASEPTVSLERDLLDGLTNRRATGSDRHCIEASGSRRDCRLRSSWFALVESSS